MACSAWDGHLSSPQNSSMQVGWMEWNIPWWHKKIYKGKSEYQFLSIKEPLLWSEACHENSWWQKWYMVAYIYKEEYEEKLTKD